MQSPTLSTKPLSLSLSLSHSPSLAPSPSLSLFTGWWFVSISNQEGWAPCSYLERLNWEEEEEEETVTTLGKPDLR